MRCIYESSSSRSSYASSLFHGQDLSLSSLASFVREQIIKPERKRRGKERASLDKRMKSRSHDAVYPILPYDYMRSSLASPRVDESRDADAKSQCVPIIERALSRVLPVKECSNHIYIYTLHFYHFFFSIQE